MDPAILLAQATVAYRAGRLDVSFQLAAQAVQAGELHQAPTLALLCLAEAGQLGTVDSLLALAQDRGLQPLEVCRAACADLLKIGKRGALAAFATGMPAGHPLRILALYAAACARMVAGDVEGALREFEGFRYQVKDYLTVVPFLTDDGFNVSFRQGTLVLPADSVERRLADQGGFPAASLNFRIDRRIETDAQSLYAVFADGRYIERFARNLALALDGPGRALNIHVVNSNAGADAILAALPGQMAHLAIGVSRSDDPHYATSTSYACTRFFVLPELLSAYGKPIIALDIDVFPREPLIRLETLIHEDSFDFSCYLSGRNEPASVYPAGVMAWMPNARTLAFLHGLAGFCLPKLAMPARVNWLLDQAALISVMNWQNQRGMEFRYRPLGDILGGSMQDAISLVASEEEKGAIKAESAGIEGLVDAEGIVRYDWSPD